jgi:ADP-heptose:LPS heptosyltransferase
MYQRIQISFQSMGNEKVLVIRLGGIGDIAQASGVPRLLRRKFSQCEVHWIAQAELTELISHNENISKTMGFSKQLGLLAWIKLAVKLKRERYTHVYDAHASLRSYILCWILRPHNLVRRHRQRFKRFILFAFKVDTFAKNYSAVGSFHSPLKAWDIDDDHNGSEFTVPSLVLNRMREKISQAINQTSIVIAPASAWNKKMWPKEFWKNLINNILQQTNLNILILGGVKDSFCKDLILDKKRVICLQGELTLLESAAAIELSSKVIAGDTGLLHIAEALGKNVVCLTGPTRFGTPFRNTSIELKTNLWCQPCSKNGSGICINPTYKKCLKSITVDTALKALTQIEPVTL